ncbi:hypothetical protein F0U59_26765 [Archangium gephyra]|nr:hypothetical protein F0U59_26765 [Archangium gephyra]
MKTQTARATRADIVQAPKAFEPYVPGSESAGLMAVTGCGKSHLVKFKWVPYLLEKGQALAFWDASDEHSIYGKKRPNNVLGLLRQRLTVPELLEAYAVDPRVITRRDLALSIVPSSPFLTPKQRAAEFRSVMPLLLGRGQLVFFIEEVLQLISHAEGELCEIAAVWPKDVASVFMGQTPTMFPTEVRAQWTRCISGAQTKLSDRNTIGHDFGMPFASQLQHLKRGQFLVSLSRPGWAVNPKN